MRPKMHLLSGALVMKALLMLNNCSVVSHEDPATGAHHTCAQALLSADGGATFSLKRGSTYAWSGSSHLPGLLGNLLPPAEQPPAGAGKFTTLINPIVGNSEQGLAKYPELRPQLLDWSLAGGELSLLGNRTASFRGLPDVFSRPLGSCGAFHCGVGNSGESIIRLRSGEMLLAT